jgi:DNA-directed RNA polymerase III subunit RPC1
LEDLVVNYDGTVRNAIREVVEFTYGADGLDPIFMEIKNKPVDLQRQLMHLRAQFPFRDEKPIKGEDVVSHATTLFATSDFTDSRADFKKECL